ncbi:MAG: hypothetical protein ACSHX9_02390 [Luteolibacter sp.]
MFLAIVSTLIICSPYLVWQFAIRPYCLKNGKGYTTGANWAVTMWVNWQEAKELATERGDKRMIYACQLYLWIHIVFLLIGLGIFLMIVAGG